MELSSYFSLLNKYKFVIIAVVLVAVVASFFLVKNLPDEYVSTTQVATGIVDASRHLLDKDNAPAAQSDEINREFSNLTEIIKLKKLIDELSYQLIIHDLSSETPFRKLNHQFKNLSQPAIDHALVVFREKLKNGEPLSLYDKDENGLNELLISMKYDERSIRKDLDVNRDGDSDFISITYTSENPDLSPFVVNTLCKEFLDYYTTNIKKNESNAVEFLTKLLHDKKAALDSKKDSLQQYKIKNNILNLDEQSKSIFAQILTYTDKKIEAEKDAASYAGAIKAIDAKFDPKSRGYIESSISLINQSVTNTEEQLRTLNEQYVHSGFNPSYKPALDSLKSQLSAQIDNGSDKYITDPRIAKDNLVAKRLDLEIQRELARYSVEAINGELTRLNEKFNSLVPFDAKIKTYEFDIDIASKEYLDVLNKYNNTNLQSNFSIKLMQVQPATPDVAQPSKKILLIALSGLVALFACLLVLFVLFYIDDNIKSPTDLVSKTQLPLLGSLNTIQGAKPDLRTLWDVENRNKMQQFKELLRSIRFEIDQELRGDKVLAITSIGSGEGKSLVAVSLAYSYAAINKRVALIDGNFNNPTISNTFDPKINIEDYLKTTPFLERDASKITIFGNKGEDVTLLEINDENSIHNAINDLKSRFDIIVIDLPALDLLNHTKEWLTFANKTVAVFEGDKSISRADNEYVDYLKHLGDKYAGWVLNKAGVASHKKNKR